MRGMEGGMEEQEKTGCDTGAYHGKPIWLLVESLYVADIRLTGTDIRGFTTLGGADGEVFEAQCWL